MSSSLPSIDDVMAFLNDGDEKPLNVGPATEKQIVKKAMKNTLLNSDGHLIVIHEMESRLQTVQEQHDCAHDIKAMFFKEKEVIMRLTTQREMAVIVNNTELISSDLIKELYDAIHALRNDNSQLLTLLLQNR